jgi:adenine-specific DNA glycosylase
VHVAAALVLLDGRALLERRRAGYLAGLWAFPLAEGRNAAHARRALTRVLSDRSIRLQARAVARTTHTIMRRRLRIEIFRALPDPDARPTRRTHERWIAPRALELAATPTLTRKIARAAAFVAGRRLRPASRGALSEA